MRQVAHVDYHAVRIAVGVGTKPDVSRSRPPHGFLLMFETTAGKGIDRAVDNADCASPLRPAIAVGNTRAAPAHADAAIGVAGFLLQVPTPDATGMVVGLNFVPAGVAQETVLDLSGPFDAELVTLHVLAAARKPDQALSGGGEGMTRAQRTADGRAIELVGDDAGEAALGAEHLRPRQTAAWATTVLVAAGGSSELVTARDDVLIEPAKVSPRRADLNQPLKFRVMPVGDIAASADVGHDQMVLRVVTIGEPQLLDRPAAEIDSGTFHVFVPGEGAVVFALAVIRELGLLSVQEHDVMVAARGRAAAPFLPRVTPQFAVLVKFLHGFDAEFPVGVSDLKVVRGVADHVESGDIAAVCSVVSGAVGADRIVGVYMQVAVKQSGAWRIVVDGDVMYRVRDIQRTGHACRDHELAGFARQIFDPGRRPAFCTEFDLFPVDLFAVETGDDFDVPAGVDTGIAPAVVCIHAHNEERTRLHQARPHQRQRRGSTCYDVDHDVARYRDEARSTERIDVTAEAELVFDESLDAGTGAPHATVAQPDDDVVAGVQITVDCVDDDRLLKRALMTLLVEADFERLHCRSALPLDQGAGLVFGRDVIRSVWIDRLKQRRIGIKLECRLEPRAVGDAGGADFVVKHEFVPASGNKPVDVTTDLADKGPPFVSVVEPAGGDVGAKTLA